MIGVLASGMLVSGAAATAVAADAGAGGTGDGVLVVTKAEIVEDDYIAHVLEPEGEDDGLPGGLIKVTTSEGATLFAYCLDAGTALKDGAAYREAGRSEVPTLKGNPDAAKIDWILRHGYPTFSEAVLGKLIGGKLSKKAAAGATQAAIWRLTNHVKAVPWDPAGADLADYLVAHAADAEEPAPSLVLDPGTVTGPAGATLGPITIGTTGDKTTASLDPAAVAAGVALTDREGNVLSDGSGKLIEAVLDGESLFVKVPAGARQGSATVSAQGLVPVPVGHKLASADSQSLALVTGDRVPVTTHAKASWTGATTPPSPTADPSGSASPSPSQSVSPTAPGATSEPGAPSSPSTPSTPSAPSDPGSPGASASPDPSGTTGQAPTPGVTHSGGAGEPEPASAGGRAGGSGLASTGSSGAVGFAAVAAGGLVVIGAAVVLIHGWRRRYRTMD
ncbi:MULTISPECIES: thioester domain-containing protein [Streptomyces]|uniref:Thioester domain-containing protein n=1 Tax=Streptomyces venezuelae TaxID=54571 RepID=A0A5P2AYJ6_STRVZ|nr:thioester domain-containing protein [Streptomyces venezuelae]QES22618.1 hypothetical protein DEJ46_28835 [Streptomyces venezuelae]